MATPTEPPKHNGYSIGTPEELIGMKAMARNDAVVTRTPIGAHGRGVRLTPTIGATRNDHVGGGR